MAQTSTRLRESTFNMKRGVRVSFGGRLIFLEWIKGAEEKERKGKGLKGALQFSRQKLVTL